jgi:hypothetical protein
MILIALKNYQQLATYQTLPLFIILFYAYSIKICPIFKFNVFNLCQTLEQLFDNFC